MMLFVLPTITQTISSGLPGLLLTMGNAERTEPLLMIGPRGLERVVNSLRTIAPELPFEIHSTSWRKKEETLKVKGYKIHAFRVQHNVPCYGYTLEIERAGRFDVERAKAAQIPQKYWSRLQKGEVIEDAGRTLTQDMVLGPAPEGHQGDLLHGYPSGAGDRTAGVRRGSVHLRRDVCGKGKEAKARQYKHMTFYEAAKLAAQAEPAELWLTHFSPSLVRGDLI